ncbi:UDP-N-acetylmuramyl pentapeptide phosphotransferase/UDP-N-acetylglucosamine-1-phosphate transferase [Kitasatospora sp. MAP12-15]|nr:hypothetical protein [Kitasatospora sp. MAP12-44]MDH6110454.1 UDP-N-acetylmuramyl pentapeptide phosphotransferase/UDP-N-acetylglucosamine-1-phosphate transferase [Kitasatospora sp. MAP12-44]
MGVLAFFAALLAVLMGLGRWHETQSPYWLAGSLVLLLLTLIGALQSRRK